MSGGHEGLCSPCQYPNHGLEDAEPGGHSPWTSNTACGRSSTESAASTGPARHRREQNKKRGCRSFQKGFPTALGAGAGAELGTARTAHTAERGACHPAPGLGPGSGRRGASQDACPSTREQGTGQAGPDRNQCSGPCPPPGRTGAQLGARVSGPLAGRNGWQLA